MESIRAKKSEKFKQLRKNKDSSEFEKVFLKYTPGLKDQEKIMKQQEKTLKIQEKLIEKSLKDDQSLSKEVQSIAKKTRKNRKSKNLIEKILFPV